MWWWEVGKGTWSHRHAEKTRLAAAWKAVLGDGGGTEVMMAPPAMVSGTWGSALIHLGTPSLTFQFPSDAPSPRCVLTPIFSIGAVLPGHFLSTALCFISLSPFCF